jgi:hypothetical protein
MIKKGAIIAALASMLWLSSASPVSAAILGTVRLAALQRSPKWWVTTPDAWHIAYLSDIDNKEVWFLDGRKIAAAPANSFSEPGGSKDVVWVEARLSRDGRRLAYVQRVQDEHGKLLGEAVCVNGRRQDLYDEVSGLTMSEDGRHLAYIGRRGDMTWVVADGRPGPAVEQPSQLQFNSAGASSYQARIQGQNWLYFDNKPVTVWPSEPGLSSPDRQRFACVREASSSKRVFVDDLPMGPAYSVIRAVTFSPDGRRVAFFGFKSEAGPSQVVSDGVAAGPELDEITLSSATELFFSPADGSLSWFGRIGGSWRLYTEGRAEGDWDSILGRPALAFSPRGRRAYAAVRSGQLELVVDGKAEKGPDVDIVPGSGLAFDNEQEFHFLEMGQSDVWVVCASAGSLSGRSSCLEKARQLFLPRLRTRRSVGSRPNAPELRSSPGLAPLQDFGRAGDQGLGGEGFGQEAVDSHRAGKEPAQQGQG